jgi:hypothetical protein
VSISGSKDSLYAIQTPLATPDFFQVNAQHHPFETYRRLKRNMAR